MMEQNRFTTAEAADFLRLSSVTLCRWRKKTPSDVPPIPFHRLGGKVIYLKDDLVAFLEQTRVGNVKEVPHG